LKPRLPEKVNGLTFSPLQPPHQLQSLDDLLAQAEHYAGFCMRNSGKMSPTLFLIGADGPLMFVPASLVDAVPGMDKMEGRFAQILSPKVADDQMRLLAKTMLNLEIAVEFQPVGFGAG
jgi:hypothetical protein